MKWKRRRENQTGLLLYAGIVILPLLFVLSGCFMGRHEILKNFTEEGTEGYRLYFLPEYFTLEQFQQVLLNSTEYVKQFWNTVVLWLPGVLGALMVSLLGGYALALEKIPCKKAIFALYLLMTLLPVQILLVPQFVLFFRLDMINSHWSVILLIAFLPMGTLLVHRFLSKVPIETVESAQLDGANRRQILFRILLPQIRYGMAGLTILLSVDVWEMSEQPLVFLQDKELYPLSVTLSEIMQYDVDKMFVCGLLYMIPMILLYGICSEEFEEFVGSIF